MLVIRVDDCPRFLAGDHTWLREILHPEKPPRGGPALNLRYSLAHAALAPGEVSLRHRLSSSEVYHILRGRGRMHQGEEAQEVGPGDTVYIPPGTTQWIESIGSEALEFLCIVDPAWRPEQEEVGDG